MADLGDLLEEQSVLSLDLGVLALEEVVPFWVLLQEVLV